MWKGIELPKQSHNRQSQNNSQNGTYELSVNYEHHCIDLFHGGHTDKKLDAGKGVTDTFY